LPGQRPYIPTGSPVKTPAAPTPGSPPQAVPVGATPTTPVPGTPGVRPGGTVQTPAAPTPGSPSPVPVGATPTTAVPSAPTVSPGGATPTTPVPTPGSPGIGTPRTVITPAAPTPGAPEPRPAGATPTTPVPITPGEPEPRPAGATPTTAVPVAPRVGVRGVSKTSPVPGSPGVRTGVNQVPAAPLPGPIPVPVGATPTTPAPGSPGGVPFPTPVGAVPSRPAPQRQGVSTGQIPLPAAPVPGQPEPRIGGQARIPAKEFKNIRVEFSPTAPVPGRKGFRIGSRSGPGFPTSFPVVGGVTPTVAVPDVPGIVPTSVPGSPVEGVGGRRLKSRSTILTPTLGFPGIPPQFRKGPAATVGTDGPQFLELLEPESPVTTGSIVEPINIGDLIEPFNESESETEIINITARSLDYDVGHSVLKGTGLYHPKFTFFSEEERRGTTMVHNSSNLDIFNTVVATEVAYVLNTKSSILPWNEIPYSRLGLNLIALSLNPSLLTALDNITNIDGQKIRVEIFLDTIRKLMFSNRLEEFDPTYYITLSKKQSRDLKFVIEDVDEGLKERFAIGNLGVQAKNADYRKADELNRQFLKRYRPSPVDIEASINVQNEDGTVSSLPFGEEGLLIDPVGLGITNLDIGPGAGFYISTEDPSGVMSPLESDHILNRAFYSPGFLRDFTLGLLGSDPTYSLSVTSTTSHSEFDATGGWTEDNQGVIGYFILDKMSITTEDSDSPFVTKTSANYILETTLSSINEHIRSDGFSVTRVNVDFRDYFHQYALDNGTIALSMNDVGYTKLRPKRSSVNNQVLLRSFPSAIILVPGQGSKHNPYASVSRLVEFKTDVVRQLGVRPDINFSTNQHLPPVVKYEYTGDLSGVYNIGLIEALSKDLQTIVFTFDPSDEAFTNTYFRDGTYLSSITSFPTRPTSYLVREIIDGLFSNYEIKEGGLTWWDIFSRMTATQYASLDFEVSKSFYSALENGWRGVNIREVLNRLEDDNETGLVGLQDGDAELPSDFPTQIITSDTRHSGTETAAGVI
jgi:hypothetical protein